MERVPLYQRAMLQKAGILKAAVIIMILSLIAQPVFAQNANPTVAPPNSKPYGKSYSEWNAEWWKYVLSMPADGHPLLSTSGENCGVGQSGPVFFLMGNTGGTVVREKCVVPTGKALFFPIANFICAVPEDGATLADIQGLCSWATDLFIDLAASVDGVRVPLDMTNLKDYRAPSPGFPFTGAIDNPFDQACGTPGICYEGYHETGFSDGYWIMLHPLPAGEHTINFSARLDPTSGWDFALDVTYKLTVKK